MPIPTASGVSQLVVAVARTLLLAGGISGCVAKHVVPVSSTGTPSYKRLSIEYAVEGGTLSRILSVSEPPGEHDLVDGGEAWHDPKSDVVPETGQPRADTDDRDRETSFNTVEHAKLLIEYPHPEERLGYALATLEFHQEPLDYQERNVVQ
ncbi:MAG: hypothetical protein O3A00_18690, partial [Planctomycetota bacterium]|nr:hypothetical protein [Planctomycetota bacterium]